MSNTAFGSEKIVRPGVKSGCAHDKNALPEAAAYYVNAQTGSDSNPGISPRKAWKSIERVNRATFIAGDRIFFAGNQTFTGMLHFTKKDGGSRDHPVQVSSYSKGRAVIDAGAGDGFRLEDCTHVVVQNLKFMGSGRKMGSDGTGIRLVRTHDVLLQDIDVSGFRMAGVATEGDENSRIVRVHAHDNGSAGIMTNGGYDDIPRSRNLYIGDCVAENNPGDPKNLTNHSGNGIVVGGVDGALIEYCEASNNGWDMPRDGNGPVGIWGWNCDRLTIQHCISHDNKSPGADGGGFDFDGGVTNSVMQYNLSYNNMGCGYLLCQYPGAAPWKNNVVRYNISIDDGSKNFQAGIGLWLGDSGISDALIYNNTIVNPSHAISTMGDLPDMVYRNNIFLVGGDVLVGDLRHSRFEHNLYWSTGKGVFYRNGATVYDTLSTWAQATGQEQARGALTGRYTDPKLLLPRSGQKLPTDPRKLAAMRFYRLRPDSPCIGAGILLKHPGEHDFFNNHLDPQQQPSLGAHEAGHRPINPPK